MKIPLYKLKLNIVTKKKTTNKSTSSKAKAAKKIEKKGVSASVLNKNANLSTRNVGTQNKPSMASKAQVNTSSKQEVNQADVTASSSKNAKPGSIAAKANLVKQYNEKNNK